jgi:hypothetical protein
MRAATSDAVIRIWEVVNFIYGKREATPNDPKLSDSGPRARL